MNIENMCSKLINDRLDELEIEHWKQVILHEHELEELVDEKDVDDETLIELLLEVDELEEELTEEEEEHELQHSFEECDEDKIIQQLLLEDELQLDDLDDEYEMLNDVEHELDEQTVGIVELEVEVHKELEEKIELEKDEEKDDLDDVLEEHVDSSLSCDMRLRDMMYLMMKRRNHFLM